MATKTTKRHKKWRRSADAGPAGRLHRFLFPFCDFLWFLWLFILWRKCTMAEPQEAPAVGALTSRFPDAPTPRLGNAPDQGYRSLSVLALLGFGISALYAAIC